MKIGFVDYYISEWHANNYPAWIKEIDPEFEVAYAWAEKEISPVDGVTTAEWCKKFGAVACASIEELCEKSDFIIVLSPDNPENHLRYVQKVFPFGKPCYVDKTFAPNAEIAKEIFALAEKYHVPMFSSSALRFADELSNIETPLRSVAVSGAGQFDSYLIHFVEIAVRLMGADVKSMIATSCTQNTALTLKYADGRIASLHMYRAKSSPGFEVAPESMNPEIRLPYVRIGNDFFKRLIANILKMFRDGTVPVKPEETVTVMAILDLAHKAVENPWTEITL